MKKFIIICMCLGFISTSLYAQNGKSLKDQIKQGIANRFGGGRSK